jgi:hypothetical protein
MVVSAGRHCVIQNQLKLKIFVQEKTFEVIVVDKSQDPSPAVDGPPLASADCLLSSTMLSPSCLPIAKCKLADEDSLFRLKCRSRLPQVSRLQIGYYYEIMNTRAGTGIQFSCWLGFFGQEGIMPPSFYLHDSRTLTDLHLKSNDTISQ